MCASQASRRTASGVSRPPVSRLPPRFPADRVVGHGDHQLRPVAAGFGQLAGGQGESADLDRGVGAALLGHPVVQQPGR
jgi:hypothetical protein